MSPTQEILEDKEVAAKLPLVFGTLRRKRLSEKTLRELVERIRSA